MKASEHPQYPAEKQQLDHTIDHIEAKLAQVQRRLQPPADDYDDNRVGGQLHVMMCEQATTLDLMRPAPYFGRVDWLRNGDEARETFYVGKFGLPDARVFAWQDTLVSDIYYAGESRREAGRRLLKRTFQIDRDDLVAIYDDEIDPSLAEALEAEQYADSLLLRLLREHRAGRLHDIVATIQAQQHRIIQASREGMLVVQGAPGSGKSSVALHRLSYLLYHHRDALKNVLVLAPSGIFLNYTAGILPALEERRIPQLTVGAWISDRLGGDVQYEPQDLALEQLLDESAPTAGRVLHYRADRFKGSPPMATLIDRHLDRLNEKRLADRRAPLTVTFEMKLPEDRPHVTLTLVRERSTAALARELEATRSLPYNERRDRVIERVTADLADDVATYLSGKLDATAAKALEPDIRERVRQTILPGLATNQRQRMRRLTCDLRLGELQVRLDLPLPEPSPGLNPTSVKPEELAERLVEDITGQVLATIRADLRELPRGAALPAAIAKQLERQVRESLTGWDRLNLMQTYRHLLNGPELLREAGEGIADPATLELLGRSAPAAGGPVRFGDLAPLLYLKVRLDGPGDVGYDHIVIDEAQDFSPLFYRALRHFSRDGSITVLGDLAQGIYGQHGLAAWEEAGATGDAGVERLRQSYRSTQEIIGYANAMLRRSGAPEEALAEPIARPGPAPGLHPCADAGEQARRIAELIDEARRAGRQTIAVIGKTAPACRALAEALRAAGVRDAAAALDRDGAFPDGVCVLPAYLAKGLEFDVVIITDADAATYPADDLHRNLLYVALTRAAHELHVCWVGEITPFLDDSRAAVAVGPPLAGRIEPTPVTVEAYARAREVDPDDFVVRLAKAGRLPLLSAGVIDESVLEILLADETSPKRRTA